MKLYQVIEITDLAFVGRIVDVDIECYTIEIEELLYGEYTEKTISIVKFANWQDHHRFKEYEAGQHEIVFTKKSNNLGYPFEYISIGAGNEGEIEIVGDSVIVLDRISRETKFEFNSFREAIIDYKYNLSEINKFFDSQFENYYEPFDKDILDTIRLSNRLISELKNKSDVHKLIIDDKQQRFYRHLSLRNKYGCKKLEFEPDIHYELFRNHENRTKINVVGYNIDSIDVLSEECEVFKKDNEFYLKPKLGEKTKLYFIYRYNNQVDTIRSFEYHIEDFRERTIDTEIFEKLKKYPDYPKGSLSVTYGKCCDWSNFYDVLSFDLNIITEQQTLNFASISSRITYKMIKAIRDSSIDDKLEVYNIKAFDDRGNIVEIDPIIIQIDINNNR